MLILGVNSYYEDSSACLVEDGNLTVAVEEGRFNRIKHWAGFPAESIRYCLRERKIDINDVDYIAINHNPGANSDTKILYFLGQKPDGDVIENSKLRQNIEQDFSNIFNKDNLKPEIYYIDHHTAHLASSFYVSPFKESALISVDTFGDFVSTVLAVGKEKSMHILQKVYFPHSLGIFYQIMTHYLGFKNYGDEYKVMGLAAYGEPKYLTELQDIVKLKDEGVFELNQDYFRCIQEKPDYSGNNILYLLDNPYTDKLIAILGPDRNYGDKIEKRHKDIACSVQVIYEQTFFHMLNYLYKKTETDKVCISGVCGFNSVANGKVFENTPFKKVYITSNPGDGGGAIGAAYYLYNSILKNPRKYCIDNAFLGPSYSDYEIQKLLESQKNKIKSRKCTIAKINRSGSLYKKIARYINEGKIIGWFQGRMEWGPRALGNRSIICDPRCSDMKDILNLNIKMREDFRPFACTILRDYVREYFQTDADVPFMSQVFRIWDEKRTILPAVTHVNGSVRLQTLSPDQNLPFYRVIEEFMKITGIPLVLNTSFNENEPIVNSPEEALECFLRTDMDVLVMGDFIIQKISLSNKMETFQPTEVLKTGNV